MTIRLLTACDTAQFQAFRLKALQEAPESFTSSYAYEAAKPAAWFQASIEKNKIFAWFEQDAIVGTSALHYDFEKEKVF